MSLRGMKQWRRLVVASVLVAVACAGAAVASARPTAGTAAGSLTYVMGSDPLSLDPAVGTDTMSAMFFRNVYDRLLELAPDGHTLTPGLAKSWSVSHDGRTYLFHLRKGVRFQSGEPLDADAVAFSYRRVLAIGKGDSSLLASHVRRSGITAVDPSTVRFRLIAPYAPFPQIVGLFDIGSIVDPAFVKAHATAKDPWAQTYLAQHMDGTGAFSLQSWTPHQFAQLQRNDSYWRGRAHLAKLVFQSPGNAATESLAIQRGDVDIVDPSVLSADQLKTLAGAQGVRIVRKPIYDAVYWVFNTQMKPFDDVRVRRAIAYAIDYRGIVSAILGEQGVRLGGPLPIGILAGNAGRSGWIDRNVAKAKQLLAAAGHSSGLQIELDYVDFGPLKQISTVMQANLAQIGVKATLKDLPLNTLLSQLSKGKLGFYSWESNPPFASPDAILYSHYYSKSGNGPDGNLARYRNPTVDRLLVQARKTTNPARAAALYRQVVRLIESDAPDVFISQSVNNAPVRDDVHGFTLPAIGGPSFWGVSK